MDAKALHNDTKQDNIVLQGEELTYVEGVLIDLDKAGDVVNPKIYHDPADLDKYSHLALELGAKHGKQSKLSCVYSMGFVMKNIHGRLARQSKETRRPHFMFTCQAVSYVKNLCCDLVKFFSANSNHSL